MGAIGVVAAGLLAVGVPAAMAAVQTGTTGCGAKYGWLVSTTTGSGAYSNRNTPPGSQITYIWDTSGTRDVVAAYSSTLTSKTGGGSWVAYGASSASGSPHCENYG